MQYTVIEYAKILFNIYIHMCVCIYIYVCMCVCVSSLYIYQQISAPSSGEYRRPPLVYTLVCVHRDGTGAVFVSVRGGRVVRP